MVPGVSRSGATIVGAMLLGSSKRAAAEFSFFLALPTMAGAFAYDLLKNYKTMTFDGAVLIGIGFVAAFISALVVVKTLLGIVSNYGFKPFAWWRILVGGAGLVLLLTFG
jgi:undecaprenyl-diphosphatase